MIKNYIKIAWRRFRSDKLYVVINVLGLTVGVATCILIALYVGGEFSYDRFHENGDRIYRLKEIFTSRLGDIIESPGVPRSTANLMEAQLPEIEQVASVMPWAFYQSLKTDKYRADDVIISAVEPDFYDVFSFSLISGNKESILHSPNGIMISESLSERFFGEAEPIGEVVTAIFYTPFGPSEYLFTVEGVFNNMEQSHLKFDAAISPLHTMPLIENVPEYLPFASDLSTPERLVDADRNFVNYLLLSEGVSASEVEEKIQPFIVNPRVISFELEPLTDIYLFDDRSHQNGNIAYIYLFSAIGVLILAIAIINYMTLSTARGAQRATEVGIRKACGADRSSLIKQFLGESVMYAAFVLPLAFGLVELLLPGFGRAINVELSWAMLENPLLPVFLILFVLLTCLAASIYPALFLSKYRPASVLKDNLDSGRKGLGFRRGLIVVQFALSSAMILASVTVFKQLEFVQNMELGFDQEQVLLLDLGLPDTRPSAQVIKAEFMQNSRVVQAALTSGAPGVDLSGISAPVRRVDSTESSSILVHANVGADFIPTMGIELLAGRGFLEEDLSSGGILNREGAEAFGWETPGEALGVQLRIHDGSVRTVVGVVENFYYQSLRFQHEPMIMVGESVLSAGFHNLVIKAAAGNLQETIESLQATWEEVAPGLTFTYRFLDEAIDQQYRSEQRIATLFGGFTTLAIVLSGMGLFGLAAYTTNRRVKEIGIRKVLGASVANIVTLLSKDFVKLVLLGFVIAVPIAWYAMNQWLQDFAYSIEIGPEVFALAGGAALFIALATVSWQSVRAALANPVESLRSE